MILWTIQPPEIYDIIKETGVFHCDPALISMPEFAGAYDWLATEMIKRVGPPPEGVTYPVWAWHTWYGKREKPDLRRMRWETGDAGEKQVCLEIDIPDDKVLLSDYDAWHAVLNDWLLSDSEEESDQLEAYLETLSTEEKAAFKHKNWKRVFDVSPFKNDWTSRGDFVQATFWELRKDQIRGVRHFTADRRKEW